MVCSTGGDLPTGPATQLTDVSSTAVATAVHAALNMLLRARPPLATLGSIGCLARVGRHCAAARRCMSSATEADFVVIGAGPVGASTAWYLGEDEANEGKRIVLVHDPTDRGAHEDWSRLARLSFDGPAEEMDLSRHAVSLLDLVDEVRSYQSGAPVVPIRPGMLFLASPGTAMAQTCAHGEAEYGDPDFVRRSVDELPDLYPGNSFELPADTLCWTHPTGLCVSPIELADCARNTAAAYGVEVEEGRAGLSIAPDGDLIRVTLSCGKTFDTPRAFLMAGAQSKQICAQALAADPTLNADFAIPEFDETYISAISTVRYAHRNHPASPAEGSGHVAQPITLGQLEIPDLIGFQANFSVVAEEMGDVYKTRLSGDIGTEVIETVAGLHDPALVANDGPMGEQYGKFFGALFPHLQTEKALDFNRCVTYRNHNPAFSGTSLLEKPVGGADSTVLTTAGCFGVGVKFGPALGQAAAAHTSGQELERGMNVFRSGEMPMEEEGAERVERAW